MTSRSVAIGAHALLLSLALAGSGCSALVERGTVQCSKDSDCARMGPAFAGTVCTADRVCGREPCQTRADCTEHFGAGAYCRPSDLTCVNMLSESCDRAIVPDEPRADGKDPELFGFMAPLRGEYASYGTPLRDGAELALERINASTEQAVALLVCHDGTPDEAKLVAQHLAHEVGFSAIVGPAFSGVTRVVVNEVLKPAGVLSISPSATSPDFANWSDDNLFWRTVPSDTYQAPALVQLVDASIAELRTRGGIGEAEPPRVSTVWIGSKWGDGIQAEVDKLLPKGKIELSQQRYAEDAAKVDWAATAAQVAAQAPHVVIALGTGEFAKNLLRPLEKAMAGAEPVYVMPEGGRVSELEDVLMEQEPGSTLAARVLGTAPGGRQSQNYLSFESAHKGKFMNLEPGNLSEFAFDAVYLLALAMKRVPEEHPTGHELARALSELSCKGRERVALLPFDTGASWRLAQTRSCVDYEGASGPVDFDKNGEIQGKSSDMQIWCPHKKNGTFALSRMTSVFYDAEHAKIEGTLSFCSPD
jgi:ABC-type branched-subunit amino acid transport system substrate-binding protein